MRGVPNPELKAECIRLRLDERLSLREIHDRTGASKGSLSSWLRPFPLTETEVGERQKTRNRYRTPKKDRGCPSKYHQMVSYAELTKSQKAKVSEAAVLFRAVLHGYVVFGSPFDGDRADWIIETGSGIHKVQVKSVEQAKTGLPTVSLRHVPGGRGHKRYSAEDFDFIVGYDLYTDTCYVWSFEETKHLAATVTICPEAAERWEKMQA